MGDLKEQMEKWKLSRYKQPMRETLEMMKEGYEGGVLSFLKKQGFGHIRFSYGNLYVPKKDVDQIKKALQKETEKVAGDVEIMPKSILGEEHDCTKVHPNKTHKEWLLSQAPVGDVKEEMFDEGRMKDIYTMDQEGKSAKEIAIHLNLKVSTVKSILGEEVLNEFTNTQITSLKKDYEGLRGKTISGPSADKLRKIFDKIDKSKTALVNLLKADIPFLSMMASSRLISKYGANASQLARMRKEELEEKFEPGFAVRYLDPANKKRFVVPLKTKKEADDKAAQLKRDGCKDITITKHDLNFKENIEVQITKKGSGSVNKRSIVKDFNNKAEAEKWIKWYKTGNMKDVESIKLFDLAKTMKYMDNSDSESGFNIAGLETDRPQRLDESADYLASKMNDKQLANIKNVWKNKKASDVTQSVKDMIKKMDIPTQLAIKHADIPHLSKLVEGGDSGDDDSNFAIGMSKAKEIKKDYGSPLKKSTIVKGHEIAKSIKKDEHVGAKATFERLWSGHKRGDK
jgi:hypothetical protein